MKPRTPADKAAYLTGVLEGAALSAVTLGWSDEKVLDVVTTALATAREDTRGG